jgi:hypothetical protein
MTVMPNGTTSGFSVPGTPGARKVGDIIVAQETDDMAEEPTTAPDCEDLATRWLDAEERSRTEPSNQAFAADAARLGEAYEAAVGQASQEDLRLAWESARQRQAGQEMGSRAWTDARRVSELLRTEYEAARDRGNPSAS